MAVPEADCGGERGALNAVADAGCGWGEVGVLISVPIAGCGGQAVVLVAVSDAVCGGRCMGSYAVPHTGCWGGETGFSWQSQTLVVGVGEVEVLMAVPDAGCGGGRGVGSHGSLRCWLWGGGERQLFSRQVPDTGCDRGKSWGFSWQSQSLVVGGESILPMAVSDAGCGGELDRGSYGSPRCWFWWGREVGVLMAVPDAGCGWEIQGFSRQSQTQVVGPGKA